MEKILRASLGIKKLDKILDGGIPRGNSVLILGSPGSGKTIMGLQFINEGLERGEKCIIVSLEETTKSLKTAASLLGFDFEKYIREGKLLIEEMPEAIEDPRAFTKFGKELSLTIAVQEVKRIFIDPLAVLETAFIDKRTGARDLKTLRVCLDKIFKSVKRGGATLMITSEVDPKAPNSSRDTFVEYIADGIIKLNRIENELAPTKFVFEVMKMRKSKCPRNKFLYEIRKGGVNILEIV